jgi:hypothetical protein
MLSLAAIDRIARILGLIIAAVLGREADRALTKLPRILLRLG